MIHSEHSRKKSYYYEDYCILCICLYFHIVISATLINSTVNLQVFLETSLKYKCILLEDL